MPAYLCTRDRLLRLRRDGDAWTAETALEGERLQCVAARDDTVLAGTLGAGALLSRDAGETWERIALPESDVFSVAISAADGALYAGTEPSRLFVARDGGAWAELALPSDAMPYALAALDGTLLCGMSDGRVLTSGDDGATWDDAAAGDGTILAIAAQ